MKIEAKAADMIHGIRARKTRAWEKVTLQDILTKIANEHGLEPAVSDSVKSAYYSYLAQTSESDLNFLTRLARDLDAVAKPAGGSLVFVKRGEGKSASGQALPVHKINRADIDTGTWSVTSRGKYGRVTAEWGERGSATLHKVTVGDKEPELVLRHPYASKAEAERAAQSALDRSERASGKMSLQLGGFYPNLMAEAQITLPDIKAELRGEWLITKVRHSYGATLTTSIDIERGKKKKMSAA
ncbi:phage tail protein [Aliiroseovarius crassostreae]|nr:phage tail protein [Aliiroseovarius crassostreae]